jgi:hypothetical protein
MAAQKTQKTEAGIGAVVKANQLGNRYGHNDARCPRRYVKRPSVLLYK